MKFILSNEPIITLIGPDFFTYIQAIRDELISRGYQCHYFDERHSNSILTKIFYRLRFTSFIKTKRDQHLNYLVEQVISKKTTDIFLIDTEVITSDFVELLTGLGIKIHIYMWDSAKNKKSFLELLPLLNGRASFEPLDCKNFGLIYIPLFAENMFASHKRVSKAREGIVFLGTLHSHRTKLLQKIELTLKSTDVVIKKLLYYHSKTLYLLKSIQNPFSIKYFLKIRTHGYSKEEIAQAYFEAKAVLDIHHPGQSGLTSRTFESLRSGAWLITLNKTVNTLPVALRERIILVNNVDEIKDQAEKMLIELKPISEDMDYFLSLERFVDDLLNLGNIPLKKQPSIST